jgi:hypothetical protein
VLPISEWLPQAIIGVSFTALGGLKFYGLWRGVVGGADKPLGQRLCGT